MCPWAPLLFRINIITITDHPMISKCNHINYKAFSVIISA
uniref:Uncharacterized protein n=1 Tax=Arundo donax TaxID=35708 RepID=A0A0A8Y5R5_ARUDO